MMMHNTCRAIVLAMTLFACGCSAAAFPDPDRIVGDTPGDIASSITRLKARLDPDRKAVFAEAVTTLTLVVPDKNDRRSIGYMSPDFVRMVSGRTVDQIVQLAVLYRLSVPRDHR
jgi:hypothetical protein